MFRGLSLSLVIFAATATGGSQDDDELREVEHAPAPCMDTEEFPLIEARVESAAVAERFQGLTIRFKAEDDVSFYETTFRATAGTTFQAALPKPLPTAGRVTYYFVAGRRRSPEYHVPVLMGGCPGARTAPDDVADDIRVRRTVNEQSEIPSGFSADGIRAGGSMSGTTLGIVAAAGGGAGVAALIISGDDTPPDGGGGLPPNPEAIRACFTPDPIPDIDSGESILFDASCTTPDTVTTYQWSFGDGSSAQGSSVEHLFVPGGVYSVTLTATEGARSDSTSRLVRVIATPSACFITNPDPPRILANQSINFNAECSEGDRDGGAAPITRYEWDFGDGRPGAEGVFVSRQFPQPDVYGVRLTVTNEDGIQGSNTQFIVVEADATVTNRPLRAREMTLTSELALPRDSDSVQAQLSVNDTHSIVAAGTIQVRAPIRPGENVVEARLLTEASGAGTWRLDFRGADGFVAGSIRVDTGEVISTDARSVIFRLTGKPGPFVRFRFRASE